MKLYLTDRPVPIRPAEYDNALADMARGLAERDGAAAVYQLGSVSDPGISDLDVVAVFPDGAECRRNPRARLSAGDRRLFVHQVFGVHDRHFRRLRTLPFLGGCRLLTGTDLPGADGGGFEGVGALERQVALEFLLSMYISLSVSLAYGIVKVRGLLLQGRALLLDFDLLGEKDDAARRLVEELAGWRTAWFDSPPADKEIERWVGEFYRALEDFVDDHLKREALSVPGKGPFSLAGNITLKKGDRPGWRRRGIILPSFFGGLGRRYFNLQHRLNSFTFTAPLGSAAAGTVMERYFTLVAEAKAEGRSRLPHFMTPSTSLNIL